MCKFSSKSGGVPFQPLGDLTWNDPIEVLPKVGVGGRASTLPPPPLGAYT